MREKHMFCYLDFCSYLKANDPNSFHFLLKVLLFLRFITKSTYQLLNPALKKPTPEKYNQSNATLWAKQAYQLLSGNQQCNDVKVDTNQTR